MKSFISFPVNELSLNQTIAVYVSSINALIDEYLVQFEYFKKLLAEKHIFLVKNKELSSLYGERVVDSSTEEFSSVFQDFLRISPKIFEDFTPPRGLTLALSLTSVILPRFAESF